jgi:hypothetical protein
MTVLAFAFAAAAAFTWQDTGDGRLELRDKGQPVLTYNYGMQLKEGAPEIKRRAAYVHPVWAPNGAVVTDDFPRDHWHHRGVFWAWPVVRYAGVTHDMWTIVRTPPKARLVKWIEKKDGSTARLAVENGWFLADKQIVRETVRMTVHPVDEGARKTTYELTFEALDGPVEIMGSEDKGGSVEKKGYGGFNVRFAPRTETVVRTDKGVEARDTDMIPHPWAEMEALYDGKRATLRVEDDPKNPGYPNGWCLRKYGFLGVNYPGIQPMRLEKGKPVTLRYTVTVSGE